MRKQPGYISVSEGAEMHGAPFLKDRYEGRRHPLACLTNTKKELEEGKKAKRSEDRLHKMFLQWAKKEMKKYESEEEQEKMFKIWLSTKKSVTHISLVTCFH